MRQAQEKRQIDRMVDIHRDSGLTNHRRLDALQPRGVEVREDGAYGKLLETKEWNQVGAIWIDNNECIRCGQCYTACPVQCISISRCELTEVEI